MIRTQDATFLNAVANDPSVRLGLGHGTDPLDFTGALADLSNYAFADENGGFMFISQAAGRYELHTLLSPRVRGRAALGAAADAIRRMFVETDCTELVTRVPGNLAHADLMARRAGFREVWNMPDVWPGPGGLVALRVFAMTMDEWIARDGSLVAEGEAFHAMLAEAAAKVGHDGPLHPTEDEVHERVAGVTCLMVKAGNWKKALWTYARWAVLSGYRPVQVVSETPLVFHTGNALVMARHGALEVLEWLPQQ